jgi:lipoyl(octanoyl) transferase
MSGPDSALPPYRSAQWRLIVDTIAHTGALNMAIDETIMQAVSSGGAPPTLRFYQWNPPCISLGKHQPLSSIDLQRCWEDGVLVVRRSTGGLAILHTDELTYSLVTHPDDPRGGGAILDSYRKLSQGLVLGLGLLGVTAQMQPVNAGVTHNASAACFDAPSAYEITVDGRKLIGSAQTRPHGKLLQHGSVPLSGDIGRLARYLVASARAETPAEAIAEADARALHLRQRATTLEAILGRTIPFLEVAAAMAQGFTLALNLSLLAGALSDDEVAAADRLAAKALVE